MGDAALAIFPVGDCEADRQDACRRALQAALDADRRSAALNTELQAAGRPTLAYGIGLHEGEVLYGNIGIPSRVEFTVIGSAANTAARVESLAKDLGAHIVLTEGVAQHLDQPMRSCGLHQLRGVEGPLELFTPA